jgi:hypothetical protein
MTLGELSESDDDAPVDAAAAAKAAKKIAKAAKKAAAKKAAAAVPTIGSQTIHLPRALSSPTKPRPPADVDDKAFGFLSATSTAAEKARLAIARAGRASASASGKGAGAIKKGARTASSAGAGGTSTIARLVEEKRAEEARKRKLATQTKKLDAQVAEECANRDRERAMAMASLVADREVRAMHAVTDRVREMERDANEQLEDGESGGIDETPYPSDVVRALSDDAFVLSADDDDVGEEEDDAYHAGEDGDDDVPSDLRQFADAAEAGAASRGDLREAANETARKEALREVLTGGWLARAFISRTDAAAAATTTTDADGIDDLVDRQSKLLAMMGLEKKDSVGSSIGKQRASSAASSKATSVSGNNAETDSFANDSDDESWAEDDKPVPSEEPESKERTEVEHAYSHADLKKLNVGCDAVPAGVDVTMFEEADLRKVEQAKREAAEKKKKEKAEKEAAEKEKKEKAKAEKEAAEKEKKEKASADKAAKESARERVAKSKSTDTLDDAPALGGALGLGFLGINNSSSSLASQGESTKEGEKKDESGTQAAKGMSVKDLAAALMAELRGLEDRVEVLGEEESAMVALKLGAALEAVRQEPFKSI